MSIKATVHLTTTKQRGLKTVSLDFEIPSRTDGLWNNEQKKIIKDSFHEAQNDILSLYRTTSIGVPYFTVMSTGDVWDRDETEITI